jgi:hypothetical protein
LLGLMLGKADPLAHATTEDTSLSLVSLDLPGGLRIHWRCCEFTGRPMTPTA